MGDNVVLRRPAPALQPVIDAYVGYGPPARPGSTGACRRGT